MAQAETAFSTFTPDLPSCGNDNFNLPPGKDGDRWRWVIDRLKSVSMCLAVYAAQERLRGKNVDAFCDEMIESFERFELYQDQGVLGRTI